MSVYTVRMVPVRIRWHFLWELHIEGMGVTQSRRRRRDAERTVRDYVHLMSGVPRKDVQVVLVPLGTCTARDLTPARRLIPCTRQAVHVEPFTDSGCPDDPHDGPHHGELLLCARHRHLAESRSS